MKKQMGKQTIIVGKKKGNYVTYKLANQLLKSLDKRQIE